MAWKKLRGQENGRILGGSGRELSSPMRMDTRILHLVKSRPLTGISLAATVLWLVSPRGSAPDASIAQKDLICNPYDQPGYFDWDPADPYEGRWTQFRDTSQGGCPDAPDWIAMMGLIAENLGDRPPPLVDSSRDLHASAREKWDLRDAAYEQLTFLQNRTVLIIGDSVDRNSMDHLGYFAKSPTWPTDYLNASFIGRPEGWDIRGVPHVVHMHRLDTQVSNLFMYGTDDKDVFSQQVDWHAPGKAEHRLNDLFLPFTQQLKYAPSFIQLHSGMWDLALFGRQDAVKGASTELALDPVRVQWWAWRMRSIVSALREAYPGVPIWMRLIHRVGTQENMGSEDYTRGVERQFYARQQNFFTDLRCAQLREMQMALARELCLPINDFGRWWEGYQTLQDKVHPLPLPGGRVYVAPLLHSIWMEAQGREKWAVKPCATNWRVEDQEVYDMER